jgi:hypothetical protein
MNSGFRVQDGFLGERWNDRRTATARTRTQTMTDEIDPM